MSLTISPAQIVEKSRSPLLAAPDSWTRRPLGEVATIVNGFAFKSKQFVSGAGKPLIRIRDMFNEATSVGYVGEYEDKYLVQPGELIVGMDGDFGAALWQGPEALLNQRVCKIIPNPMQLDLDFLSHVLPGYLQAIRDVTSSTTVTHLSSRDIAEIPIPVPSLREQRAIAQLAGTASQKQRSSSLHLEVARRAISRFRLAVLAAGCSGRLTAEWRARNPGLVQRTGLFTQSEDIEALVETPEPWVWCRLADIADVKGGVQKGGGLPVDEPSRDVPYLRVANVQRGWLDLAEIKTIRASEKKIAELRLEPGDVLFNEGGDRDKLGRGWVWEGQIDECIHQNHVFRARLRDRRMQPRFFSWYGNTVGASYFSDQGKQTVNLASLSMTKLKELPVPVPNVDEQAELVRRVDRLLAVADEVQARIDATGRMVDRSSQSVLAKAFRGELPESDRALLASVFNE